MKELQLAVLLIAKHKPFVEIKSKDHTVEVLVVLVQDGHIARSENGDDYEITPKGEGHILTLVEELYCEHRTP